MSPHDDLSENDADTMALIIRETAGTLGPFGSIISEVCTSIIPNQKAERIIRYVRAVANRLEAHAERMALIEARMRSGEGSDLFEEGASQAARAVTDERIWRLARTVTRGMTDQEFEFDRMRKLMALVATLTDSEFIVLRYHSLHPAVAEDERRRMMDRYRSVLYPVSGEIGLARSEADRGAFKTAFEQTLVSVGLLAVSEKMKRPTALGTLRLRYTEEVEVTDPSERT